MLPIRQVEQEIVAQLRASNRLTLCAPTGSGKSTQVPRIIYEHHLQNPSPMGAGRSGGNQKIIILQPRRLAARLVAQRVASEMSSPIGQVVGYQTRHDSKVSRDTAIRFMTEGLFLRLLQSEPTLPGVGAVILDEFHERSVAADVSLALVKRLQETARPDLKLIVMSATLPRNVTEYLKCPLVEASGRLFPVDVHYLQKRSQLPVWDLAAQTLAALWDESTQGHVLIFMPGGYEIRRTIEACRKVLSGDKVGFFPLHGELPVSQQDAAVSADPSNRVRKVIVSTNVAETSITIEGVLYVIDSGQARINRFDPRKGLNSLRVEPISQSSAQQRAGRAGRTAPGQCYRLWTESDHRARPANDTPEIARLDLSEVMLQLASMGITSHFADSHPTTAGRPGGSSTCDGTLSDGTGIKWLDAPAPQAVEQAQNLLRALDAFDESGQLTEVGRVMAQLPMHPRLSRLLVEAARRGCLDRAYLWAALAGERDILIGKPAGQFIGAANGVTEGRSDFLVLEEAIAAAQRCDFDPGRCQQMGLNGLACREVSRTRELFVRACADVGLHTLSLASGARGKGEGRVRVPSGDLPKLKEPSPQPSPQGRGELPSLIECLLVAFPDHIACRTSTKNLSCALVGSRRAALERDSIAQRPGLLVAVEISNIGQKDKAQTILALVSEVEPGWLSAVHPHRVHDETVLAWNQEKRAVERVDRRRFDDLVFEETARGEPDPAQAAHILAEKIAASPAELKLDHFDEEVEQWIARVRFVAATFPDRRLITYNAEDLLLIFEEICAGAVRFTQVSDRPVLPPFRAALSWEDQQFVESMAPARLKLPSGKTPKVAYSLQGPPKVSAKIQELYGLKNTPTVAGGKVKTIVEILGPNYRPLQTTEDLAGFWKNLYPTLKKELSRKYPRHEWR